MRQSVRMKHFSRLPYDVSIIFILLEGMFFLFYDDHFHFQKYMWEGLSDRQVLYR